MSAQADDWIVLPERVHPFTAPSLDASTATLALRYPETFRANLIEESDDSADATGDWLMFLRESEVLFLPDALAVRRAGPRGKGNYPIGRETVDREHPLPLDYVPDDLVKINQKWNFHGKDLPKRLRAEAARAAERMLRTARDESGIELRIASSYRSAAAQRHNYLAKVRQAGPGQRLVAKPGHSEHQLGTALDICGRDPQTALKAEFADTPEGRWLRDNAARFGFRFSYTKDNANDTGYDPEPWHIRYMGKKSDGFAD